jgi:hypothetical protein
VAVTIFIIGCFFDKIYIYELYDSMARRFILVFLILFACYGAHGQVLISLVFGDKLNSGQVEFGLDGGLNLSTLSGTPQAKLYQGFNLGFYFDIKWKDPWMFHTGVMVKSVMGAGNLPVYSLDQPDLDATYAGGSVERKLSYFNVPFLLKYAFQNNFYAEAGPLFGLLYKATDEFSNTVQGNEVTCSKDIRDQFHPLDAGLMAGIGYRLLKGYGMNLGIHYYYGLVDVTVDDSGEGVANRSLYFTVGIPIGAGKAAERAAQKAKETEVK